MALAIGDQSDAYLWARMLEQLEQQTKAQVEEIEDDEDTKHGNNKLKNEQPTRTASPGPVRRGTWS